MYILIDESGDASPQLIEGSARYFTIALVFFANEDAASKCSAAIERLRSRLGPSVDEFHFRKNATRTRLAFLEIVRRHDFTYITASVDKTRLSVVQRNKGRDQFYADTLAATLASVAHTVKSPPRVVIDENGSAVFQKMVRQKLKEVLEAESVVTLKKLQFMKSHGNNLLQLADYVASIEHRAAIKKKDADAYRRYLSAKEISHIL